MQDGNFDMMHLMNNLEGEALQRLTEQRHEGLAITPEMEDMLAAAGIFWDEISEEYFSVDAVLVKVMRETVEKHSNYTNLEQ